MPHNQQYHIQQHNFSSFQNNQSHGSHYPHQYNSLYGNQAHQANLNQYRSTNGTNNWQQADFQGINHTHHYHAQNVTGINTSLPVNAKYP